MPSAIDQLYHEAKDIIQQLVEGTSLQISASNSFGKSLLLASASYFEKALVEVVLEYVGECSRNNIALYTFVQKAALERKFHTFFDFDRTNANKFFALFGNDFQKYMKDAIKEQRTLEDAIVAFMEICSLRNSLVHQDYATFPMPKTLDDIYELHKKALLFLQIFPLRMREFHPPFLNHE